MDAASYLVAYAFLTSVKPLPFLGLFVLGIVIAAALGWRMAKAHRTEKRISERFARV